MSLTYNYIKEYLDELQPMCTGLLGKIQRENYEKNVPIISNDVVRLISFILSVKKPESILEIGSAVGFSSALMSKFLKDGGKITTIDRFDVMINKFKENIKTLKLEDTITLLEGDAMKILPSLNNKYDIIFLDAAKGQYIQMLPYCLRLLNIDGILIADDVMQDGRIAMQKEQIPRRQRTIHRRMRDFLYQISHNDALETSILTIGDGVALCHKIKETE